MASPSILCVCFLTFLTLTRCRSLHSSCTRICFFVIFAYFFSLSASTNFVQYLFNLCPLFSYIFKPFSSVFFCWYFSFVLFDLSISVQFWIKIMLWIHVIYPSSETYSLKVFLRGQQEEIRTKTRRLSPIQFGDYFNFIILLLSTRLWPVISFIVSFCFFVLHLYFKSLQVSFYLDCIWLLFWLSFSLFFFGS